MNFSNKNVGINNQKPFIEMVFCLFLKVKMSLEPQTQTSPGSGDPTTILDDTVDVVNSTNEQSSLRGSQTYFADEKILIPQLDHVSSFKNTVHEE